MEEEEVAEEEEEVAAQVEEEVRLVQVKEGLM